mmetsp:Transcript_8229/g.25604  ORF Transcript_8229/g.25604 Transcript_8229/m.25604 type:complete len:558 (-) Transcript_8229:69-1742(-)
MTRFGSRTAMLAERHDEPPYYQPAQRQQPGGFCYFLRENRVSLAAVALSAVGVVLVLCTISAPPVMLHRVPRAPAQRHIEAQANSTTLAAATLAAATLAASTTTLTRTTTTAVFHPSSDFTCSGAGGCGGPFVGVNLGGWLLLEDWIWPEEMQQKGIGDEWTLIQRHGGPQSPEAIAKLRKHWDTFVTEEDLDRLRHYGVTHVRIPIGYWLVDFRPEDGFIHGGSRYLFRVLAWLKRRGMRALLDLHALPGGQAPGQSFTGKKAPAALFFQVPDLYERGKNAMLNLAQLILTYERNPLTSGVVLGMEPVNAPDWEHWATSPGVQELYEDMVPKLRALLPAERYAIFLNFMESPRTTGSAWLARMRAKDPESYRAVIYDAHMYHSYGDDNKPGRQWNAYVDSCKTCCRDPYVLEPLVSKGVPIVIGEYSLNTGFPGSPEFYLEYLRDQLSLWASIPGVVGSFFWNHRILRNPGGWYKEMSLLELLAPHGPLPPVSQMNLTVRCPGKDLSKCPVYNPRTLIWSDSCAWKGNPDLHESVGKMHEQRREDSTRTHKGDSSG